tara:strand:- start:2028 stop:2204 length:177 start_codon:yes stop_codon:yes gene_type:complete
MVNVGTASSGQKELKTKWPVVSGLTAGTTKQTGRITNLVPYKGSTVARRLRRGLNGKR